MHGRGYRFSAELAVAPVRRSAQPESGRPSLLVDTDLHPGLRDPFVGRDALMQRLGGALDKALAGIPRARLLVGEPGIGKTRVCQELAARAREAGARVWSGRCYEADRGEPLWPWIQILRQAVDPAATEALNGLPPAARAELSMLVPELERASLPPPAVLPPPAAPGAEPAARAPVQPGLSLFDAITRFVRASAQRVPLLLVLDDLHWADTATLSLLGYLLDELGSARVLVLGTFRDAELEPGHPHTALLDRLERNAAFKRIALSGLLVDDVACYVNELTGQSAPPELARKLHERTAGNPFFVRETVRALTTDALAEGHLRVFEIALPESARDVIRRRVLLLPEAAQQVLQAGSVLGLRFELGLLGAMLELDSAALLAALDRALAARLLFRADQGVAGMAFAHAVVRDTVYDDLPSTRKCELHLRAGEALEQQRSHRPASAAEIALHYYRALPHGDGNKAFEHGKRAAEQAAAAGEHELAADFYRRAYEGLSFVQGADANRSAEVMLGLGRAHRESGHPTAAREALDRVLELSQVAGASEAWAKAARRELERLR